MVDSVFFTISGIMASCDLHSFKTKQKKTVAFVTLEARLIVIAKKVARLYRLWI